MSSPMITLQGINISHLGRRKIIFKMPFLGDMLVPWRIKPQPKNTKNTTKKITNVDVTLMDFDRIFLPKTKGFNLKMDPSKRGDSELGNHHFFGAQPLTLLRGLKKVSPKESLQGSLPIFGIDQTWKVVL